MNTLSTFTKAIGDRLTAVAALPGSKLAGVTILIEDAAELEAKIEHAMAKLGLVILIGQPVLENTTPEYSVANMKITTVLGLGEDPLIWRDAPLTKPLCLDVVEAATQALQGLLIEGFAPLRVLRADFIPNKTRQLYELPIESQYVIEATT